MEDQILDIIPLWGFFLVIIILSLIVFEIGFRLGSYVKSSERAPTESIIAAMLGLLAFMLAFTFGFAANHFENRRGMVLEEANAIKTTYLRSQYLPEPYKKTIPPLLKEYVAIRM